MKDYTITLDFVLQALIIFEGLSLWKLSEFAAKKNSASLLGKDLKEELRQRWKDMRNMDNLPWGKMLMAAFVCIVWPVCKLANSLVWFCRWTPYISGTLIPLAVVSYSVDLIPCEISANLTLKIAQVIFWFITGKLGINILTPLLNRIPFSQIQVKIPDNMLDGIKR